MSVNTMERILWDLHHSPDLAAKFLDDPDAVIAAYPLGKDEREFIRSMDVHAIAEEGVSQMLLYIAWLAVKGPGAVPEYMRKMNASRAAA